ncbi:response regulator transcription factor [Blastococcus sp. MG754426]|uniref:response regulator n=1 Tax=unclassified Blastococcus TaxID=2619396 RepID=UPI001EEFF1E3|nr:MULTISPECIES: response regulator transcription factor [unclassified Blastococcus]MCF6508186.1 response regulator transcription factor [Blastococcus sp. MG754426]MCF6512763.1 response regulator transcription factor [Blastococcus sp. MG754427]
MIRVLVVDDHSIVRTGLAHLLGTAADVVCVGTEADGRAGLAAVAALRPDVLLLDLSMPVLDGVEVIRALRAAGDPVRILVLTSFADADLVLAAVHAGADGYLLKQSEAETVLDGVRAVVRGDAPVDPAVARSLLSEVRGRAQADPLTEREREVLELIRQGQPNKSIARRLAISERTVKAHVTHILQRLGVADRTQAALWAERHRQGADRA